MGEFHYSRYPESEWESEILKMKAGGVQIVSTYVIWIHHEEVAQGRHPIFSAKLGEKLETPSPVSNKNMPGFPFTTAWTTAWARRYGSRVIFATGAGLDLG
jgi:hypothetical protein